MSLGLGISTLQEPLSDHKGQSRVLLHSSTPPKSPLITSNLCEALESNGRQCQQSLRSEGETWCRRHSSELKDFQIKWDKVFKDAERVEASTPDTARQKILKLRQAMDIRRQIRERFYSRGEDTSDFINWITTLEKDMRTLADSILMLNLNRGPTPETPGGLSPYPDKLNSERIMVLQSPLSPRIPITSLHNMPDDGTILILKHFYSDLCVEGVRRLYSIVPDLNDSGLPVGSPLLEPRNDGGTDIIRAWFRIMILNNSEAEVLEHAVRSRSISQFLLGCHASQLETYYDFFEKAWRPHALQYLRVAICAQTLTEGDAKTVELLGGRIPSTTVSLRMTKACWDILYRWFPMLLTPWTLASICFNFEDYTTVCKLLMLGLYQDYWFDRSSMHNECVTGVYLGFIPSSKGPIIDNSLISLDGTVVQAQCRNYVCGQMAIGDPLTQELLNELQKRTERLLLVVYEGTNADATVYPTEGELFIKRHRSAKSRDEFEFAEWTTDITLEDIKNDLRFRKKSMYDPIVVDSWQFIVIDREVGLPFELFDIIQDTLLMLVDDPYPEELVNRVIQEIIPPAAQEVCRKDMKISDSKRFQFPAPPEVQYEGNRQRSHETDRQILLAHQTKMLADGPSREANRFIRRVIDDMERCGIISLAPEYETPQTRPVIIQSSDGGLDLYFPYEFGGLSPDAELTPNLSLPRKSCLLDFVSNFKRQQPEGIMAKGSILPHYCAWPMPAIRRMGKSRLNFGTWEGHVYHWNAMPFDRPWSSHAWQYYVQHYINSKYPYVMFYLTTFVICATNLVDAEEKVSILLKETEKRGWRIVLPNARDWRTNVNDLRLEKLFGGVGPT
ncbi:hypothetical protein BU23DRAFT_544186 [Bimuria novae-zelandiae CBS 107.79]|uniref:Uncharacterized protein n=1 Tax=Bimuria novae-zelandiae CBS 107.79 TaxID=1447943 RepID=A0A6A5UNL5_9PLEO|nr:hypothetical protein BU23DRAFT_544186 [Bimuria novae-zelandiae CBS 107.79]